MRLKIILIEDEPGLRITLSDLLDDAGYVIETAPDGDAGLASGLNHHFDLLILDVMLPKMTGFEICRQLRSQGYDTPILMLTAKVQITDRVDGLKLGADDYMSKPFDPAELLARIEALLRRSGKLMRPTVSRISFGEIEADFESGTVTRAGVDLNLAPKELQLLRYLVDQRDRIVRRADLMRNIWAYQSGVSSRTVDVHIAWLRQKLEKSPQNPKHIQTVRGVGYIFKS